MDENLFYTVMEADGDLLEPFTPSEDPPAEMADQQQGQTNEQPPADMGADLPPEPGGGMEDLGFDETGGDMGEQEENQDDQNGNQENQMLAQKTDEILNQNLYQQWLFKNDEMEKMIDDLQAILPILPCNVVDQNDKSINRLNRLLMYSKDYVLNKFTQLSYGENLMQYQKLDSLYALLQNEIDSVLKKFQKDSE